MRILLLVALLFATAVPAADAPFLWQVQGPKATHYLLGSVHLLPQSAYPLPEALEQAYAQTRGLVLETDPLALETPEMQTRMIEAGVNGRGLRKEIDAALYARVRRQAQASDLPPGTCDYFKAWLCALSLTLIEYQRSGMDPNLGLDRHLHQRARADGRPVGWLESPETQLALFADMDAAMSEQFLDSSLEDLARSEWRPEALVRLWRENDTATLSALIDDSRRDYPRTYARLLGDRNRAWIGALVGYLRGDSAQLVVVGAAHLVGRDSLVGLLESRGFAVRAVAQMN